MRYAQLKDRVWHANQGLVKAGLIVLSFGNVSGADRQAGVIAIKPSGVPYDRLRAEDIVVLSLDTGEIIEGKYRPSSDTPTHLHLYRSFPSVGGIVHTHSACATSFAQAQCDIPCFGTTHADTFFGAIPITRALTVPEVEGEYELNTGKVIVECFADNDLDATEMPAVLVRSHGPFAWGPTPEKALENAIVLELTARMAFQTLALNRTVAPVPSHLLDRHFLRKHGPSAYYGQPG